MRDKKAPYEKFVEDIIVAEKVVTEIRVEARVKETSGPAYEVAITQKYARRMGKEWWYGLRISKCKAGGKSYGYYQRDFERWDQKEFLKMLKKPPVGLYLQSVLILPGDLTNDPDILSYVKEIEALPIDLMKDLRIRAKKDNIKHLRREIKQNQEAIKEIIKEYPTLQQLF